MKNSISKNAYILINFNKKIREYFFYVIGNFNERAGTKHKFNHRKYFRLTHLTNSTME